MSSPDDAGDDAEINAASLRHPERFAVVSDRPAPAIHRYLATLTPESREGLLNGLKSR